MRRTSNADREKQPAPTRQRDGRRASSSANAPTRPVETLQRTMGNRTVQTLVESGELDPASSQSGRTGERPGRKRARTTGDRASTDIYRSTSDASPDRRRGSMVSSEIRAARREETRSGAYEVDGEAATKIEAASGSGKPLDRDVRGEMEARFGTDLGDVNVHADGRADRLNRQVNASAFAAGSDIFFRQGAYAPDTTRGKALLAHELAHVTSESANAHVTSESADAHVASESTKGQTRGVYRQGFREWFGLGKEVVDDVDHHVGVIEEHVDTATKPFEQTLTAMEMLRTQFDGDSEEYARLTEMINQWSEGYSGIKALKDELGKLKKATDVVTDVADLADAVIGLSDLSPESIRDNPEHAAGAFEDLAEAAGTLGEKYLPAPLQGYANFVKQVGANNFFTNFARLRTKVEEEYGTFGSEEDVAALDQWFEHRDRPPEEEESGDRWLSAEAKENVQESSEQLASRAIIDGNVSEALSMTRTYVRMEIEKSPASEGEKRAFENLDGKLQEAISAWNAYEAVPAWKAPTSAHETKIEAAKRKVDEAVQYCDALLDALDEPSYSSFRIDLRGNYGLLTRVQETVDEEYDDVAGWF